MCINDFIYHLNTSTKSLNIRKGKLYKISDVYSLESIKVINDKGYEEYFSTDRFARVAELREAKLKRILRIDENTDQPGTEENMD